MRICIAASQGKGDWTAGARLSLTDLGNEENFAVVEDIVRKRLGPADVEALVVRTAHSDGPHVKIVLEVEPGSSGKAYFQHLKTLLQGFDVTGYRPTGSKQLRWTPLLAAYERGGVAHLPGNWNKAYESELAALPTGKNDDQCDAAAMSFNELMKQQDNQPMITLM